MKTILSSNISMEAEPIDIIVMEDDERFVDEDETIYGLEKLSTNQYTFQWHPHYDARDQGLIKDKTKFEAAYRYLAGSDTSKIEGLPPIPPFNCGKKAIIILDLNFFETRLEKGMMEDLEKTLDSKTYATHIAEEEGRKNQGIYLALKLLYNTDWEGVVVFASRTEAARWVLKLAKHLNGLAKDMADLNNSQSPHVEFIASDYRITESGKAIDSPEHACSMPIREGIACFLKRHGLEERIWPDDCKNWFDDSIEDQLVAHDASKSTNAGKIAISKYLTRLIRQPPPPEWFTDEAQFSILYNTLKSFIGANAYAHTGTSHPSLGCLFLLFAAVTQGKRNWIDDFVWDQRTDCILNISDHDTVRSALLTLIEDNGLFQRLTSDDTQSNQTAEQKAAFCRAGIEQHHDRTLFFIEVKFSCLKSNTNRPSLLEKTQDPTLSKDKGNTYSALQAAQAAFRNSDGQSTCSIVVYPKFVDDHSTDITRFEFHAKC